MPTHPLRPEGRCWTPLDDLLPVPTPGATSTVSATGPTPGLTRAGKTGAAAGSAQPEHAQQFAIAFASGPNPAAVCPGESTEIVDVIAPGLRRHRYQRLPAR
jgi:hypothetical protein